MAGQIPVADLRRFIVADTHALALPTWPSPKWGDEFIRSFGGVKPRRRGGVGPWAGEENYCDARGALRFPEGTGRWSPHGSGDGVPTLSWGYRRYLSDGQGVARVEAGVFRRGPGRVLGWRAQRVAAAFACRELEVRADDGSWRKSSWPKAGQVLAPLILRSTTRVLAAFEPEPGWMRPGQSLALVEYQPHECVHRRLPGREVPLALPGIALSYQLVPARDVYVGTWFLRVEEGADLDAVRRLRLHLFRIHAERECLKQVLRGVLDETIVVEVGHAATNRLQCYFNSAFKRIFKPSFLGIRQGELLRVAYETDELIGEAERASLLSMLEDIRGNIRRMVEEGTREGGIYFYAPGDGGG